MRNARYYVLKDGRVGLLRHINEDGTMHMQLGADGPFENVKPEDLDLPISEDDAMERM